MKRATTVVSEAMSGRAGQVFKVLKQETQLVIKIETKFTHCQLE